MDLTRQVTYRTLSLNGEQFFNQGEPSEGNMLTRVEWQPVGAQGYTEKRSLDDGRDASDVYLDGRRLLLTGVTYGHSRSDMFDRLQDLKSALLPTAAFADDPGNYGYMPLDYYEPTENLADWPTGERHLYVNVRPASGIGFVIDRDQSGGKELRGNAVGWTSVLEAKDPRVYVSPTVFVDFATNDTNESGSLLNRGDYPAPLNIMLVVQTQAKPGFFVFTGAGTVMTIAIPQSPNTQTIRYNGVLKVLTVETLGIEVNRRDLLSFAAEQTHPKVLPGISAYSWTSVWSGGGSTYMTIPMANGSRMFYAESFA